MSLGTVHLRPNPCQPPGICAQAPRSLAGYCGDQRGESRSAIGRAIASAPWYRSQRELNRRSATPKGLFSHSHRGTVS